MSDHSITSLIEKLEGAEAGTKELGIEVLLHFGWHRTQVGNFYGPLYQWSAPDLKPCLISGDEDRLPNPATSLDAALALAERVGIRPYIADASIKGKWSWMVVDEARLGDLEANPYARAQAATPALALCAAILRAQSEAR